jgi:hypothetical protein
MNEPGHNTISGIQCRVITCVQSSGIHGGKLINKILTLILLIMMTEISVCFIRATMKHNLLIGWGIAIFYVNRVCNDYKHFMTNGMGNEGQVNGHQSHETEYPLTALQRQSKFSTLRELVEEPFKS